MSQVDFPGRFSCLAIFSAIKKEGKSETFSVLQSVFCLHSCSWDRKLGLGTFQEVIMKQTFNFSGHHESGVKKRWEILFGTFLGNWLQELPVTLKHTVKVQRWVKLLLQSQPHKYTILYATTHTSVRTHLCTKARTLKTNTQPHLQPCCSVVLKTELITKFLFVFVASKWPSNNDVSFFKEFTSRNDSYVNEILGNIQRASAFSPHIIYIKHT